MIKTISKLLAGFTLFIASASQASSLELMVGNANTTLDAKISTAVTAKTNLFLRFRSTIDYENKVGYFGLSDLSYNLSDGLDAVAEAQFTADGLIPRLGIQYFAKISN